ncbi:MAG: Peptidylprolyl isomerase, partial [Gammaproteobacteria bacterium]|nr:Peptidylprolyl isomerase [Gammaproteobacteria bacterium]
AVRDAAQDAMSTEEKSSLKSQLQQVDANDALAHLISDLKSRADIQVFTDNL